MTNASHVLVVDDEPAIREVVSRALGAAGFSVAMAETGEATLGLAKTSHADVVILDLSLPDIRGEEICRRIRQDNQLCAIPIVILTGCDSEGLLAKCLENGADDFIHKPFDIRELVARVNALLRRAQPKTPALLTSNTGYLTIDRAQRLVVAGKRRIRNFAPKEFDLLVQIVQSAPHVIDKQHLALSVWGLPETELNARTLDVHMRRIRMKLGSASGGYLKTVPSVGYQWLEES